MKVNRLLGAVVNVLCIHKDGLDRLFALGANLRDLTPTGVADSPYHLVAASPEQLKALQGLKVEHEDITPRVLKSTSPNAEREGYLYSRGGKIPNGTRLRTTYKHKAIEAEVRGGVIWLDGRGYDNPSFAARAAGHGIVNGWKVWKYLDPKDGKWRPLEHIRSKREHSGIRHLIPIADRKAE